MNLYEVVRKVVREELANMHTLIPARVEAVKETTLDVKPVINRVVDGKEIELPIFPDVPPVFMQGGGDYEAHKISVGDYCLLLISERCFDAWYHGQDFVKPLDERMFSYSDAFALVGINPIATAIEIPKTTTAKGDKIIEGTYTHEGDYIITGDVTINGNLEVTGNIKVGGNVDVDGEVTAMAQGASVSLSTHLHTGNLGAQTSPPTGGT